MSNIPGNQQLTKSDRIRDRVDLTTTSQLGIGAGGSLDFANLNQIMEVAKVVATSACAIPGHLRDNPGACLAVCIQASEWQMSPFSVANKSYVVKDRMAYEAQLVAAVILMRAPIKDQFIDYTYTGEGQTRKCTCVCTLHSGREVKHESPEIGRITVKNSPLWVNDPDQQLGYYTVRAMARRYFPHIILGVYTPDEMAEVTTATREVGPSAPVVAIGKQDPETAPRTLPLEGANPYTPASSTPKPETAPAKPAPTEMQPEPTPAQNGGQPAESEIEGDPEQARLDGITAVNKLLSESGMSMGQFKTKVADLGIAEKGTMLSKMTLAELRQVQNRWPEFTGEAQPAEQGEQSA